jgi:hypothetical protein
MRIKLVVPMVGVACAAVTALSSSAPASNAKVFPSFRELSTGRILEPGNQLLFKASDVLITTKTGNITCEDARLTATLQNNQLKEDGFLVTAATFHNAGGEPCPSSMGFGAATITTAPPTGGWPGQARTNGKAKVTGPIELTVMFEPPGMTITCTWSATRIKATFIPNGTPLEVRVSDAKFKRVGTDATCPKSAFLSADFAMTTPAGGSGKQTAVSMS